jgi:hypothetical protein
MFNVDLWISSCLVTATLRNDIVAFFYARDTFMLSSHVTLIPLPLNVFRLSYIITWKALFWRINPLKSGFVFGEDCWVKILQL